MVCVRSILKPIVTVIAVYSSFFGGAWAESDGLALLYDKLANSSESEAKGIERDIRHQWGLSGSPAMNLLLRRGQDAMERGELRLAVEHFTALTDHAPDFPEGWMGRANAFFLMGEVGLALDDLGQVLAHDPRHFEAVFALAAMLEQLGRSKQAYDAYELVLTLHPHHQEARLGLDRVERAALGKSL